MTTRLAYALDRTPFTEQGIEYNARYWMEELHGLDIVLKIEIFARCAGWLRMIELIHERFEVFVDLKWVGTDCTLVREAAMMAALKPEFLTISMAAGSRTIEAVCERLPDTKVFVQTVPTSWTDDDAREVYGTSALMAVHRGAMIAKRAGAWGIVGSPKHCVHMKHVIGHEMGFGVPNIRPKWASVADDNQNPEWSMTPFDATRCGFDLLVCGRPISEAFTESPAEAARRVLREIEGAQEQS